MARTLRVNSGPAAGTTIDLNGDFTFGRDVDDGGSLGGDPEISRRHARVSTASSGELLVQDLGSTNGTFVNGHRIEAPTPIRPGDVIELGGSKVEVAGDGRGVGRRGRGGTGHTGGRRGGAASGRASPSPAGGAHRADGPPARAVAPWSGRVRR